MTQTVPGAPEVTAVPAAGSGEGPEIEPGEPRSWWRLIVLVFGALVFLFILSPSGILNHVLGPLAPSPAWLINQNWAMPSVAIYVTWKSLGFFILLYLAALQNVPEELYEAAKVDGASWWHRLRAVTIPGVRQVTTLVSLLAIITGANLFTEPYLLTGGGGPNGKSTSPVLQIYETGIEQNHPDFASALGVILVIGVFVIVGIQQLVQRRQA